MPAPSAANTAGDTPASLWRTAVEGRGEAQSGALRELAATYWYCVYAWWRRAGLDPVSTSTATIASFDRWLGDSPPAAGDAGIARMRDWILARLPELAEQGVKLIGEPSITIDRSWAESRYGEEPEGHPNSILQRCWALSVIEAATSTLRDEYSARGEQKLHAELLSFAGFGQTDGDRYSSVAQRLGQTAGAIRKAVFDFRNRQREILHRLVADTVLDPADTDSEITALLCACDATGPETSTAPLPAALQGLRPDEILVRAMRSVKMTHDGSGMWEPPTIAEAALLFPHYEIAALIGRGGMGAVYRGRQVELDRPVAIKLLPLEVSVDPDFADRFRREARAMAKLNHPNIILIHEFGSTIEGHLFFVMEFVEGADLHQMIHGPGVTPEQTLSIISGVCDALAYAHGKGVVHRDIKPANVMVSVFGEVKVADFGLARLLDPSAEHYGHTMTGTVMGTPDYMAPEQMRGMNVDHRADIYSLGVMLYEMLCGEVPRGIFDPPSVRVPGMSTNIDQVVIKAMQQQPDRRYQSTTDMKTDVAVAAGLKPVVHQAPKPVVAPKPLVAPQPAPQPAPQLAPKPSPQAAAKAARAAKSSLKKPLVIAAACLVPLLGFGAWLASRDGEESLPAITEKSVAIPPTGTTAPSRPPTATPSVQTKPLQEIDLLALVDPVRDRTFHGGVGANIWEKTGGILAFKFDGKNGKFSPPISFRAKAYEIEVAFRRETGGGQFHIDLPISDKNILMLVIGKGGGNEFLLGNKLIGSSPGLDKLLDGRVIVRAVIATGGASSVNVLLNGVEVAAWTGNLDSLQKLGMPPHPDVPGQPITSLYCQRQNYNFTAWKVRVFEGEVKVMRQAVPVVETMLASPTIQAVTKEKPFVNTLGMKFVPVPITGWPMDGEQLLFSVWDTRVQDYEQFVKETKREWPKVEFEQDPDHPAVMVSWDDAKAFCEWMTQRERAAGKIRVDEHYRLPSDHEWSCAAGIGDREEAAKLPVDKSGKVAGFVWGNVWPPPKGAGNFSGEEMKALFASGKVNYGHTDVIAGYNDGFVHTSPVGGFAANRLGLHDMSGNVLRWCDDWHDKSMQRRVLRGGSWNAHSPERLAVSLRVHYTPATRNRYAGIRCVLASDASAPANPANAATPPAPADSSATNSGKSLSLFDGRTLTGWSINGDPASFTVEDGCIKAAGAKGNLIYTGNGTAPAWTDFDLSMKVKTGDLANSGVWIHCPAMTKVEKAAALEVQIHNDTRTAETQKTGSIYSVARIAKPSAPNGQWFDCRIVVRGATITVWVDGLKINEWIQPANWVPPAGVPNARLGKGTIGIQGYGGNTWFKDIRITIP